MLLFKQKPTYIRTKDAYGKEIIALFDNRPIEKGGNVLKFSQKSIVLKKRIIIERKDFDNSKQADTIEELCDEFVVAYENNGYVVLSNLAQVRLYRGNNGFSNSQVYGAIWTDKGLIYVAKMNEKGDLELLWNKLNVLKKN